MNVIARYVLIAPLWSAIGGIVVLGINVIDMIFDEIIKDFTKTKNILQRTIIVIVGSIIIFSVMIAFSYIVSIVAEGYDNLLLN